MIDIHSHVLWGLDDGAKTREESIAMLELAAASGTTDIVATPHSDLQYTFDAELVAERIRDLSIAPNIPRIHRGCDFHMSFENIQEALTNPSKFTINGHNHLMVEFADIFIPPSTEEILRQFTSLGVVPVITHPERNPLLQNATDRLIRWTAMGCLLQITAQCLTDRFGKTAQKSAWSLLKKGLVHVVASDAHDTEDRQPRLDLARETLTAEMGAAAADLLLQENPAVIIAGQKVCMRATASPSPKKRWFFF